MVKKIKLFDPYFDRLEEKRILQVLKSRFWASGSGINNVSKFEKNFKKYINTKQCIAVNSGTAALHLALSSIDIKNKEVIIPSLSFVSTAHAVLYNGGKPVFVDVDEETLCLDPTLLDDKITNNTKVILPVHYAGMPCNLDKIKKICNKYKLFLVEDAAHAAGATYNNKKIGSHGDLVCFSFHPVKNLAMPTGGAITVNNNAKNFGNVLKSLRWCGIINRKENFYDVDKLGWNYYMNEFSAAIGIEQLKKLNKTNRSRKHVAKRYAKEINTNLKMPYSDDSSYHFYWILVKNRSQFMKCMEKEGIEIGIHYKPIHSMKFYKNKTNLPVTEFAGSHVVSLPTHPNLKCSDVDKIIRFTNKFL